ncbi:MAG: DNA-directed RNA polymerase subunit N [Candidatus Micrarchaeota archaeon]
MVLFPVRCFTCGAVVGHKFKEYLERTKKGESEEKVLNALGLERYCCRRMFISHVPAMEDVLKYGKM